MTGLLHPSRRTVLAGGGALVMSFSLRQAFAQQPPEGQNVGATPNLAPLPGSLKDNPMLDAWIRIEADGRITVFTGKAELGQGVKTALRQVAAEELYVAPETIELVTADTAATPNEGFTAGSQSMSDSGTAIRHASAQVREILIGIAAQRLGLSADEFEADNGAVVAPTGQRLVYGELVAGDVLRVRAQPQSKFKDPRRLAAIGQSMQRVDIPAKVTGGVAYVQDLRLPGMVHARVLRPPTPGAQLEALEADGIERMPGVLKVVREGNFVAVIAEREYQAVEAWRALTSAARWLPSAPLPNPGAIYTHIQGLSSRDMVIAEQGTPPDGPVVLEASYRRPYQMHGSIGPSCAVALFQNEQLTVWSHAQGMFPLRGAIAELVKLPPERVRCVHMEGAGCYGHNGADDAAGDAAILARLFTDRPVRVQWMREDEHANEPYGAAMISSAKAALDAQGNITSWQYDVWSNTHSTRPGTAGSLLAGRTLPQPFPMPPPQIIPQPAGGGDRNAIPLYKFPSVKVTHHFIANMPLRVSALRALGAYMNVFAVESFMDELAAAAKKDPIAFRLAHLQDDRAKDVVRLAAEKFGWDTAALGRGRGRGFGFARYKNFAAYCAVAAEVEVEHETGRTRVVRVHAAIDSGQAINPDGIINQTEGGVVQATSWTLHEAVAFEPTGVTSRDWASYPIIRFPELPDSVDVHVVNRPGAPFLGTGEAAQGPTAAAIANAVAHATGVRIRELPFTSTRVKEAIGV